jgi:hypothetical protein
LKLLFTLLLACSYIGCLKADAIPILGSADDLKLLQSAALRCSLNGQLDRSISLQEKAINMATRQYGANSPVVADMYFQLGVIALEATEFQKAQDALAQSVRINPSSVTARVKLAEILRLRGRPEAARQQALAAVANHKFAPEARQELALCYLDTGNVTKANQQFFSLSQILSGKTPISTDSAAKYSASTAPVVLPSNSTMPPLNSAAVQAEHSIIRALTIHSRQLNNNPVQVISKRAAQISSKSQARSHPSSHSASVHQRRASSRSHAEGGSAGGSLVPPPPDAAPSYPGVVPAGSQSPPPHHTAAHPRRHTPAPEADNSAKESDSSAPDTTADTKASQSTSPSSSQGGDFLLDWGGVKKKH